MKLTHDQAGLVAICLVEKCFRKFIEGKDEEFKKTFDEVIDLCILGLQSDSKNPSCKTDQ